jgi:hypothetical protein
MKYVHKASYAQGASASIMKTLGEIEAICNGEKLLPTGPKRKKLRARLKRVLIKSSKVWYKKGFNRGHRESFREWKQIGRVPNVLKAQVERTFIPGTSNTVYLQSTLSSAFRKGI